LVALALGTIASTPSAAQCYGAECDGYRSGPSRYYYTEPSPGPGSGFDRPAYRAPEPGFDRPSYRGEPDGGMRRDERIGEQRPRPPGPAGPPGVNAPPYRGGPDDGIRDERIGEQRPRPHPGYAPNDRRPPSGERPRAPAGNTITISIAEYRDLQNQARELQRLLNERRDFRDVPQQRSGPTTIYR
jgi:hypothetical protein